MKVVLFISSLFLLFSCYPTSTQGNLPANAKKNINQSINQWHKDAAKANFDAYFNRMVDSAVFIGTDAKEVWSKKEFMHFSKPYFDQKKSWNFKPLSRNVYIDSIKSIAWFDELLDTWMGICRGSGVVVYQDKQWKIQHYVLSVTIPNRDINQVIDSKKETDSILLNSYKK